MRKNVWTLSDFAAATWNQREDISRFVCVNKKSPTRTDNEIIAIIASWLELGEPRKKDIRFVAQCICIYIDAVRIRLARARDLYPLQMAVAITASFFRSKLINWKTAYLIRRASISRRALDRFPVLLERSFECCLSLFHIFFSARPLPTFSSSPSPLHSEYHVIKSSNRPRFTPDGNLLVPLRHFWYYVIQRRDSFLFFLLLLLLENFGRPRVQKFHSGISALSVLLSSSFSLFLATKK